MKVKELYEKCVKRDKEYAELYFEDKVKIRLEKKRPLFKDKRELMKEELQRFIKESNIVHLRYENKVKELGKADLELKGWHARLKVTVSQEEEKGQLEG